MTEARGKQNQSVMGQQPHIGPVQVSLKLDLPGRSLLGRKWETGQQSQQRQQRHRDHSPSTDRCMCALSCPRYKTACHHRLQWAPLRAGPAPLKCKGGMLLLAVLGSLVFRQAVLHRQACWLCVLSSLWCYCTKQTLRQPVRAWQP